MSISINYKTFVNMAFFENSLIQSVILRAEPFPIPPPGGANIMIFLKSYKKNCFYCTDVLTAVVFAQANSSPYAVLSVGIQIPHSLAATVFAVGG